MNIPVLDAPSVNTNALPTPQRPMSNPAIQGAQSAAGVLGGVGKETMEFAHQEQVKANSGVIMGRMAKLNTSKIDLLNNPKTGLLTLQGEQAINVSQKGLEAFDKLYGETLDGMTPEQQRLFKEHTANERAEVQLQLERHEAQQGKILQQGNAQALVESDEQLLSTLYRDPEAWGGKLKQMQAHVLDMLHMQGLSDNSPVAHKALFAATSAAYIHLIKQTMTDHPEQAQHLFELHQDEIEPSERDALKHSVSTMSDEKMGIDAAMKLVPLFGKKSHTELKAMLYDELKDKPQAFKIAEAQLRGDFADAKADREERAADLGGKIEQVIAKYQASGKTLTPRALASTPEYQELMKEGSPESMREATTFMREARTEQKELEHEQHERQREAKADRAEAKAAHAQATNEFMLEISDPSILHGMSETRIREIGRKAGLKYGQINQILKERQGLIKNERELQTAKVDHDILKDELFSAGYDYAYQPKTASQKSTMGAVMSKVKQAIAAEQTRRGEKLSPEEQREIIRKQLLKVHVRAKQGFWHTTDEKAQFEVEHAENYVVPGASSKDVATVVQVLKQRGIQNPDYEMVQEGVKALKGR